MLPLKFDDVVGLNLLVMPLVSRWSLGQIEERPGEVSQVEEWVKKAAANAT